MRGQLTSANRFEQSIVALAAVFQSAICVNELATRGKTNDMVMQALLKGLVNIEPKSTSELLEPISQWRSGFEAMRTIFNGQFHQDAQQWLNYSNGMLRIVRLLSKDAAKSTAIAKRFSELAQDETPDRKAIAELYKKEISTMGNRILVKGEGAMLNNPEIADAVRCALFSGIRYGWLWQQYGGTRTQFLLKRRQINEVINKILT